MPIVLVDATDNSLTVSWDGGKASSFELQYREADDEAPFSTLSSSLKSSQARKKNLQPGKSYFFRVRDAAGDEWETHPTPFATLTAQEEADRMPPPTAEGDGSRAAVVRWSAKVASGYELQMRENAGGAPWSTVAPELSGTEVRKKNLTNSAGYQFRVRPCEGGAAYSPPSNIVVGPTLSQGMKNLFKGLGGGVLLSGGRDMPLEDALAGKDIVLLYASAHWCGPCRQFTPQLVNTYRSLKPTPEGKNLEVIFLSADHDESSFRQYYSTMPWLAVPYDEDAREGLMAHIRVQGIPRLCVLDGRTGRVLEDDAVGRPLDVKRWRLMTGRS